MAEQSSGTKERPRSVRLVFEYEGDTIALVSRRPVAMVAPAPQRLIPRPDERGAWVELLDGEGRPIYRHTLGDPIERELEAPMEDGEGLTRRTIAKPAGRFSVVVPALAGARTVSLVGSELSTRTTGAAGQAEVLTFDFAPDEREAD